jgi:acetylornithine deacetylase
MDSLTQLRLTRELVDIDSTTGREHEAGRSSSPSLRDLEYDVTEQPVADGRVNIIAMAGRPEVVLTTHFDCVPPFMPSRRVRRSTVRARIVRREGTLIAQIAAVERLRESGESRVGLLFVVGEERGRRTAPKPPTPSAPDPGISSTASRRQPARHGDTRRVSRAAARVGRAAHSSLPELGISAIDKLIDAADRAPRDRLAQGSRSRAHLLQRRIDRWRRGAKRHPAVGGSRAHVPDGWSA